MRAAFLITSPESLSKWLRAPARRRTSWETGKGAKRRRRGNRAGSGELLPPRFLSGSVSLVSGDGNVPSWRLPYLPHRPVRCVSCKVEAIHFLKRPNYLTPWHGHQRAAVSNSSRRVRDMRAEGKRANGSREKVDKGKWRVAGIWFFVRRKVPVEKKAAASWRKARGNERYSRVDDARRRS